MNVFGVQLGNTTEAVHLIASSVLSPSRLPSFSTSSHHSSSLSRGPALALVSAAIVLTVDDVERTCLGSAQYDLAGVLSFTTTSYDAYVAVVCVSLNGALYVSSPALLDVGSSPSLSIATSPASSSQPNTAHVLLTLGDSYCYNSEPANKDAYSGLCDHNPTPLADVLTYTYARLTDLARFVRQAANSSAAQSGVICSPLLLHGAYDMGRRSRALLWTGRDDSGEERLGVVELHVGRQGGDEAGVAGGTSSDAVRDVRPGSNAVCGVAEPFDGLVIDAWQLPERTACSD